MYDDESYRDECDFQDPGGRSALRAARKGNPRNRTCPTCKMPNRLTPRDVQLGYQCNSCADRDEGTVSAGTTDMEAYDYPRGPWIVQARYLDGVAAFWNRFETRDQADAWAQAQIDAWTPGQLRYSFDITLERGA